MITYNGHSKVVTRLCEAVNKLEEKVGAIKDTDTTYTLSIDGNKLTLTPSSGEPQIIELPEGTSTKGGVSTYISGDTFEIPQPSSIINGIECTALVTGGRGTLVFALTLPKSVGNLTITVDSMYLTVRSYDGNYINPFPSNYGTLGSLGTNAVGMSNMEITIPAVDENVIRFQLKYGPGFSTTNNATHLVEINSLHLTFS